MASTISELKKNREKSLENLVSALNPNKNSYKDEEVGYWKPTLDKAGNAYAEIRFLPPPSGEDLPIVNYWQHDFKVDETNKFYIERSLTSLGEGYKDPVAEWNAVLWKSGNQDQARKQKRKMKYVANIYVIKDNANPDAVGKVFKFKFGPKIKDLINSQASPEFEGETPVDVFDFWEGANFKLKIRKKDDYPNYDLCSFDPPSEFMNGDEEKLEKIWKQCYSLQEEIAPNKYKTYDQLLSKLNRVRGFDLNTETATSLPSEVKETKPLKKKATETTKKVVEEVEDSESDVPWDDFSKSDDEDQSFFDNLEKL